LSDFQAILNSARRTLELESHALLGLIPLLGDEFALAVQHIHRSKSRVVVTGIGKSAVIGNKIVATMNSTGTPALFMHAADAIHGDLGSIQDGDSIICISKSGDTPEIKVLVPLLKRGENKLIAITGNPDSFLGQQADFVLNTYVPKEACPNNLAPTTSTTAQLAMGDALAVCLLEQKGFNAEDFAKFHPGGALGKKLYLSVKDITRQNQRPAVQIHSKVKDAIVEISQKMLGVTAVLDGDQLVGVITDGDIRRMLSVHENIGGLTAQDIMSKNPKTIDVESLAVDAMSLMQANSITQLIAMDKIGTYQGIVHLHNLIQEGITS
jgi:arabinose-5-phosphate isomerase